MRVVNNTKANAKTYIRNDLKSNVTNLHSEDSNIQDTMAILCNLVGGSLLRIDQEMTGYCQIARENISLAVQQLNTAASLVDKLDTTEEIPDDGC